MIPEKKLKEIRNYLQKSENPLFFFDDDLDGVSSFLLLKKYIDRGSGVIVKGSASLSESYLKSVKKYNPDIIFVLDKPLIDQEFIDKVHVPIVWIDHHPPAKVLGVHYYNPRLENQEDSTTVSYWCYKTTDGEQWMAALGIVGDWRVPDFLLNLKKKYPDLFDNVKTQPELLFKTNFGKICKLVSFLLKGKTSDVKQNIELLSKIKTPYELFDPKTEQGKFLLKRAEKIEKEYNELLEKAVASKTKEKFLIFTYPSTKTSFTGELSNELLFKFKNKIIFVGREKGSRIKFSLRSSIMKILVPLQKALQGINGYGGGHEYACGGNISKEDFTKFIENFKKEIK